MHASQCNNATLNAAAKPHRSLPPVFLAMLAQGSAGLLVAAAALSMPGGLTFGLMLLGWALLSAGVGLLLGLPAWWVPINLAFMPTAAAVRAMNLGDGWFLAAFVVLALLFWSTFRTRVPLFLSSRAAGEELAALIPEGVEARVIDIGCGFGGLLHQVAALRPRACFEGVEIAPLPAWVAWLRLAPRARCEIRWQDLWHVNLSRYDVVYAFLSPVPMAELWQKVRAEMRPGSLFVSNSFAIPGVEPDLVVPLKGRGSRALYIWRR